MQYYVEKYYGQKVTRKTAILIALDAYPQIPVDEPTRKIVFEDKGPQIDWVNCSKKHSLEAKTELIRKFQDL